MPLMHYVLSGMVAMILSWALTGCRLGNRVEPAPPPPKPANTPVMMGYYETNFAATQYCSVILDGKDQDGKEKFKQNCAQGAISDLDPSKKYNPNMGELDGIMINLIFNPMGFLRDFEGSEGYKLFNPEKLMGTTYYQYFDEFGSPKSNTFYNTASYPKMEIFSGSQCFLFRDRESLVVLNLGDPRQVNGYEALGRADIAYLYAIDIQGKCEPVLLTAEKCYQDMNTCGGKTTEENQSYQAFFQQVFDDYISRGVLRIEDIHNVRQLIYTVFYE